MSLPTSALPAPTLLRPLLTISVAIVGLVALVAVPAQALENKAFGDVYVGPGKTESDVSTTVGDVTVKGRVEGDVSSLRGDIDVGGDGVTGDVDAELGHVTVRAPVGGDIKAGIGDVFIDSRVGGDVELTRGDLNLGPEAVVRGDVHYGSGDITGRTEAVAGTIKAGGMGPGMDHDPDDFGVLSVLGWMFAAALFTACSVLAAVLTPRQVSAVTRRAESSPGLSLLIGIATVPAFVVLCMVLAVSIIGIPLLLLLAPAYLALVFYGALAAAYLIGKRVLFAARRHHVGNAMAAVVGALILAVAYLIPVLGGLLVYGFALFGAGACILALLSRRRSGAYPTYGAFARDRHDTP